MSYNPPARLGRSNSTQRRSMVQPLPIATANGTPTIITTPPSAAATPPQGFAKHFSSGLDNHPLMIHGPNTTLNNILEKVLAFVPRRRRQLRYPILFCMALYSMLLYIYYQEATMLSAIFGWKAKNVADNWGLRLCHYRKEPMLYVKDSTTVLVIWEMGCEMKDMSLVWTPTLAERAVVMSASSSPSGKDHETQQRPGFVPGFSVMPTIRKLDPSHVVYTVEVGDLPLNRNIDVTYTITPAKTMRHLFRTNQFRHLPVPPSEEEKEIVRFGAIADNQCEAKQFYKVLRAMKEHHKVDYMIHAGDAVQRYESLDNWQTDFAAPLTHFGIAQTTPMIYAHGNHDFDVTGAYPYTGKRTWHAYTVSGIRFIVLDSNLDDPLQDEWLARELESPESKSAWFRVVVVHVAPYIQYWDSKTWEPKGEKHWGEFVRTRQVPIFQRGGVDLVISGHQHNYMRGQDDSMVYTIIGGAGGALDDDQVEDWPVWRDGKVKFRHHYVLMRLTGDRRLIWEAYDAECGTLMDAFVLHSRT